MNLLNSISKKVLLGYGAILVVTLSATAILSSKLFAVNTVNDDFVSKTLPSVIHVTKATESANQLLIAAFGLYGYTIEQEQFRTTLNEHKPQLSNALKDLSKLQPQYKGKFKAERFFTVLTELAEIMAVQDVSWDSARSHLNDLQQQMDQFKSEMSSIHMTVAGTADRDVEQVSSHIDSIISWLWVLVITVIVITAAAIWFAQRLIVKPILSLAEQIDSIAETKDLTKAVQVNSKDEIHITANSFNTLLEAYRKSSGEVSNSSKQVSESINLLDHASSHADTQIKQLTHSSNDLEHGVNNLEQGIGSSAQRSQVASSTALKGAEQVEQGAANLSNTARIISELSNDIQASAEMLLELKNAGDQVSSVVKTIAEIAEQTNLLALNAAIEAARAGESGRGFAVVADEVRTLATRTHSSTYEINAILEQIVGSISSTVESMEHNQNKASDAVGAATTTVSSLDELKATVLSLSEENTQLAQDAQSNQQDATNMRQVIDQVNKAVCHVQDSANETRQASQNLTQLSHSLNDIATRYKT